MLQNNPNLKHINLAFSQANMDQVAKTISQFNVHIQSIDMWKSRGLSSAGLRALAATCSELEEVDFGWWWVKKKSAVGFHSDWSIHIHKIRFIYSLRDEASPGESLLRLLKGCPNLKKLFLAAIRGLTDRDLENIANLCPNLEQLDLLGVMGISTEKCYSWVFFLWPFEFFSV